MSKNAWNVAGVGDFNGDGMSDIVWRNWNGQLNIWEATATGGFVTSFTTSVAGNDWSVVGVGDFDGNGLSDIVWKNTWDGRFLVWSGADDGAFVPTHASVVSNDLRLASVGDFDGNGTDDLAWQAYDGSGSVEVWTSTSAGAFDLGYFSTTVGDGWNIQSTGDEGWNATSWWW